MTTSSEKTKRWPLGFLSLAVWIGDFVPNLLTQAAAYKFDVPDIVLVETVMGSAMFAIVMISPVYLLWWTTRHRPKP